MADDEIEDPDALMDENADMFEDQRELQEGQMDTYAATFPEAKAEQNLYQWFWKVVNLKKPFSLVKVGKLTGDEIGKHSISIRESLNLWVLGHTFHHGQFGDYWATLAKINSASSMAKDGWFMDLSISQRKIRERSKSGHSLTPGKNEQPWRIFRRKKTGIPEE